MSLRHCLPTPCCLNRLLISFLSCKETPLLGYLAIVSMQDNLINSAWGRPRWPSTPGGNSTGKRKCFDCRAYFPSLRVSSLCRQVIWEASTGFLNSYMGDWAPLKYPYSVSSSGSLLLTLYLQSSSSFVHLLSSIISWVLLFFLVCWRKIFLCLGTDLHFGRGSTQGPNRSTTSALLFPVQQVFLLPQHHKENQRKPPGSHLTVLSVKSYTLTRTLMHTYTHCI